VYKNLFKKVNKQTHYAEHVREKANAGSHVLAQYKSLKGVSFLIYTASHKTCTGEGEKLFGVHGTGLRMNYKYGLELKIFGIFDSKNDFIFRTTFRGSSIIYTLFYNFEEILDFGNFITRFYHFFLRIGNL
jgi:hypothetical protein